MTHRRALRATAFGSAVVVVTALIIVVVLTVTFVRKPLPDRGGEVHLAGLLGRVTVFRDAQAVPQIYATSPEDLFRVQGYVNAQDRFFQMDLDRHITAGRLSELVGKDDDAIQSDALVRTLGWRDVAEQELPHLSASTRDYLNWYADGVNEYIHGRSPAQLSISYRVLGHSHPLAAIEPWTAVDSLTWLKAIAWEQRSNYDEELDRARDLATVRDIDRVDQIFPPYPYTTNKAIIPTVGGDAPMLPTPTGTPSPGGTGTAATGTNATGTGTTSPNATGTNASGTNATGTTATGVAAGATPARSATDGTGTGTSSSTVATPSPQPTGTPLANGATGTGTGTDQSGTDQSGTDQTGTDQNGTDGTDQTPPKPVGDPGGVEKAITSDAAQQVFTAAYQAVNAMPDLLGDGGEGIGSNSWVVSGNLTASGLPILSDDPHMPVSMPGAWTQVGLRCVSVSKSCPFDVTGFGFAGLPGVVSGHNGVISWGMTNLYPDVTDFYLEKVNGGTVEKDGKYSPLTTRTETIAVAGGSPVTITIRSSSHGPLISDVPAEVAAAEPAKSGSGGSGGSGGADGTATGAQAGGQQYALALDWTALKPGHAMDALFGLDAASNFAQFRKAALKLDAPAQNLVYADFYGHIGYQAPGRIPVRGPGIANSPVPADGSWPHPGWDSSYDWKGTVPVRQLPWEEDPKGGFIVAANQSVTGPNGPVQISSDFDYGYRSERIRTLITNAVKTHHQLTVADMRVMQNDTYNSVAATLVPLLLQVEGNDRSTTSAKFTQQAVDLLRHWDYNQPANSAAAAYFNQVWVDILNLTFSDELPEGSKPDGGDRWFAAVSDLIGSPHDEWWDNRSTPDVTESRDEVLRTAMTDARLQLTGTLGKDPKQWQWGRLHEVKLVQTPLGGSDGPAILHKLFDKGPYKAPGGSSIVDAFSWDAASGSDHVTTAPSMRMIVDMSDLDGSRWVNESGISGHPGDKYYADQIQTWLHGGDYSWPFSAGAIKAAKEKQQLFVPGTA